LKEQNAMNGLLGAGTAYDSGMSGALSPAAAHTAMLYLCQLAAQRKPCGPCEEEAMPGRGTAKPVHDRRPAIFKA
jgi:hypothetical protein